MSTKDDALIADIARAISGSGVTSPASLRKARAALAIARKAILEEAVGVAKTFYGGDVVADAIRSLSTQEQHNG